MVLPPLEYETITNHLTNPTFRGDGTWSEITRNLFINPRTVTDGTWDVYRKNLCLNPILDSSYTLTHSGGLAAPTSSVVSDSRFIGDSAVEVIRLAPPNGLNTSIILEAPNTTVTAVQVGNRLRFTFRFDDSQASVFNPNAMSFSFTAGTEPSFTDSVTEVITNSDGTKTFVFSGTISSLNSGDGTFTPKISLPVHTDDWKRQDPVIFGNLSIEKVLSSGSIDFREAFDPSAEFGSYDPDMRTRWLGTVNASESVMEIPHADAWYSSDESCIAGVTKTNSLRVIRISDGTGGVTCNSVYISGNPRTTAAIRLFSFNGQNPKIPVLERPLNSIVENLVLTSNSWYRLIFSTGLSNHVDQITVYPDNNTAPFILGRSASYSGVFLAAGGYEGNIPLNPLAPFGTYDPDMRTRFIGTEDNSASVLEIQNVEGVTSSEIIAGVSQIGTTPAIRLIATGDPSGFSDSYARMDIPEELSDISASANLTLKSIQTGNLESRSRRVAIYYPDFISDQAPNSAGTYPVRVSFSELTSVYQMRLYHGGVQGSPDVWWTSPGLYDLAYTGPSFNGDSAPFVYNGRLVYPQWDGEPGNSTSSFRWYLATFNDPILKWDIRGERFYRIGVDHCVLYPKNDDGVAWNGVIAITESVEGGTPKPAYIDGFKYGNVLESEDFTATIQAFSAPSAFYKANGEAQIANGLFLTQQPRETFGFSYRTLIGSDTQGETAGYLLHLVYNAMASPTEIVNATISDSSTPVSYSWSITTSPAVFPDTRPTAHVIIDSRKTSENVMMVLEAMLYGTNTTPPQLPTPEELLFIFTL